MLRSCWRLAVLATLAVAAAAAPSAARAAPAGDVNDAGDAGDPGDADRPLPVDRSITQGTLPNGVRFLVAPRPGAGRAVIWMRVDAGSLHEEPGEEGLAHFVEHMAFTGTRNYPRGSLTRRLAELGLTFGTDENATTTLRATTYKLALPRADAAALAEAVRIMADFAYRREPTASDVAHERAVILEEMRAADDYAERVDGKVLAVTFAGTRVGTRLPLGAAHVVESTGLREIDRFLGRWYRPERTSLLVAGDVDPAAVREAVAREFAAFRARTPPPREPDARAAALHAARAAVVTDPGQPFAEVRLLGNPSAVPARTVGDYRRGLAARLAAWMLNERLREAQDAGARFDDAYAEIEPIADGLAYQAAVYGFAPPGAWRPMLEGLVAAVDGAARGGFSQAELGRARAAVLAQLRARAAGAPTRPVATLAAEMNRALGAGQPLLSPAQSLALAEELSPLVDAAEANAAYRAWFSATERLLAVILPARPGLAAPTRAQVARLAARAALASRAGAPATSAVDALLDEEPEPGDTVQRSSDPDSGVTSLTLSNGVRVHLRSMAERKGEVRVQVTLAGGELLETAATRGLTEAAALAFDAPATDTLSPATIRSHLAGRSIALSGCACDGDALTAELTAETADLEKGMRLLHLVLARGRVPAAALEAWRDRSLEWAAEVTNDPELRVDAELASALAGGDTRARPLTAAQIARVTQADAQAWFDRHRASAPLEAALVGDAPLDELARLARKYLGSLPERPRTDARLALLRHPQIGIAGGGGGAGGGGRTSLIVDNVTPRAALALAWHGPDADESDGRDALDLAAASLTDRLRQELRVRRGLTYSVALEVTPSVALRGTAALTVSLSTDPRRVREAARLARQIVDRFAAVGPTADELAAARRQVENRRAAEAARPAAWADALAALDYRRASGSVATLAAPAASLAQLTADDVRTAIARYVRGEHAVTMVANPRGSALAGPHASAAHGAQNETRWR